MTNSNSDTLNAHASIELTRQLQNISRTFPSELLIQRNLRVFVMEQIYGAISWCCIILSFVAPQVYPWNVTGFNVSSTAIYIQWSPIPPELVAGVLREYRIVLDELTYDNVPIRRHTIRLSSENLFVNLTGLAKYRNYTIELQGISKFFGVSSPPIIVITDEDGKKHAHEYGGRGYSL